MKELSGGSLARTERIIKEELGDQYIYYRNIHDVKEMKGLQAIIPCEIELN